MQWAARRTRGDPFCRDVEALATSVPDTGGVMFVPALTGLGAPHWDPYARGTLLGISRGTTAAHIARAALEGIAFQVADITAALREDSGLELTELRVDGGASRNDTADAASSRPVWIERRQTECTRQLLSGLPS